jgi:hypothetical protein
LRQIVGISATLSNRFGNLLSQAVLSTRKIGWNWWLTKGYRQKVQDFRSAGSGRARLGHSEPNR